MVRFLPAAACIAAALSGAAAQALMPLPLPMGFEPEGVVSGPDGSIYVGSLAGQGIVKFDSGTEMSMQFATVAGPVVGLTYADGYVYACGGPTGMLMAFNMMGVMTSSVQLAANTSFINDAIVMGGYVYATDSNSPMIYRSMVMEGGGLGAVEPIMLSGDWQQVVGFNANGIEVAPDMQHLLVVNMANRTLFLVDPATGAATAVPVTMEGTHYPLSNADGLLRCGNDKLFVVQNFDQTVAVLEFAMADGMLGAHVSQRITDATFDVPTTVAIVGSVMYLPNARFGITSPPPNAYNVSRVDWGMECAYDCPEGCSPITAGGMAGMPSRRRSLLFGSFMPTPTTPTTTCPVGCMPMAA